MNRLTKLLPYFTLSFMLVLASCSATKEQQVEDELADFRNWVSNATANVADRTEEDWERARADFKTRTQELDQKSENFSEELKQDYKNLKAEFQNADEEYRRANEAPALGEWEGNLLGNWANYDSINEENVREAYITLLENVRQQRGTWDDQDWEMAKQVMEKLNTRKNELDASKIPTDTEVKIKALQMEFHTLETAADATDEN
ncbi:hypothetical protein [Pontibacter mangrovi]|uniref:Uncharacterized protein n=1 Tax=Pontibacter mangrovi TaxID=2589816 RepID=A0A501WCL6_9BACT|nr:hypothetical protein [Pontibacter mangrovi]TPE43236.1 hypothetical protein FJM65_14070 [Pontibacter mangrovi]